MSRRCSTANDGAGQGSRLQDHLTEKQKVEAAAREGTYPHWDMLSGHHSIRCCSSYGVLSRSSARALGTDEDLAEEQVDSTWVRTRFEGACMIRPRATSAHAHM